MSANDEPTATAGSPSAASVASSRMRGPAPLEDVVVTPTKLYNTFALLPICGPLLSAVERRAAFSGIHAALAACTIFLACIGFVRLRSRLPEGQEVREVDVVLAQFGEA